MAKLSPGKLYDTQLAHSLRMLIDRHGGSVNAWSIAMGLNQSTINRIANGDMDATCSKVAAIAEASGYAAWQLLHPDFDPRHMPTLDMRALRIAAIYAGIKDPALKRKAEAIMERFDETPIPAPTAKPAHSR